MAKTATKQEAKPRTYGYELWYHSVDSAPRSDIPTEISRSYPTAADRDGALLRYVPELERQGYTIVRVSRHSMCGRCDGTGEILIRPRGRKSAPWWLCRRETCPDCQGDYRVVEG